MADALDDGALRSRPQNRPDNPYTAVGYGTHKNFHAWIKQSDNSRLGRMAKPPKSERGVLKFTMRARRACV
jgi:hypothetical protein